jgi:hypothetical protein
MKQYLRESPESFPDRESVGSSIDEENLKPIGITESSPQINPLNADFGLMDTNMFDFYQQPAPDAQNLLTIPNLIPDEPVIEEEVKVEQNQEVIQ